MTAIATDSNSDAVAEYPIAIGYLPSRVIRHVMTDDMEEDAIRRYLAGAASLASEFVADGRRYHLMLDARRKSFRGLAGLKIISKGIRGSVRAEDIERSALVSEVWFGSADADGIPSFKTLAEGWRHLTDTPYEAPQIALICGSTGAGKTGFAKYLARDIGGLRYSIDEWMNALYLMERPEDAGFDWYWQRIRRCESMMRQQIEELRRTNLPVVLDLGLSTREHRSEWYAWARRQGVEPWLYYLDVDVEERRRRVMARNASPGAQSMKVTPEMFDFVEGRFEAPDADEAQLALVR